MFLPALGKNKEKKKNLQERNVLKDQLNIILI